MKDNERYHKDITKLARKQRLNALLAKKRAGQIALAQAEGWAGTVISIGPGICVVRGQAQTTTAQSIPGIAIGDRVVVERQRVTGILPRRTVLSRPDPHNSRIERVLAANIDVVVIVGSIATPPFRPGFLDRCLIAAEHGGAEAVICINKTDVPHDPSEEMALASYRALRVPVVMCSAKLGSGVDELRWLLLGKTCVFTGHSGVGKSSLLNALSPELQLKTGEVGQKGRHTTTSSSVHFLDGGITLIDTPGIRELGLWRLPAHDLHRYFPEFEELSKGCAFSGCTHTHEPVCGVRDAGLDRYPAYLRILGTLS